MRKAVKREWQKNKKKYDWIRKKRKKKTRRIRQANNVSFEDRVRIHSKLYNDCKNVNKISKGNGKWISMLKYLLIRFSNLLENSKIYANIDFEEIGYFKSYARTMNHDQRQINLNVKSSCFI